LDRELTAIIAAIRAERWAILPEYLEAIEAIVARALGSDILARVAADGHEARLDAARLAVAAVGERLDGSMTATLRDGAAVIPILGPIFPRANMVSQSAGGAGLDAIMRDFRVAQSAPNVDRIVLLLDSPGGVVSGLGEASAAIRESAKPVTSFVTGIAASAAYWLGSQAKEIVLDASASVGSIGVVATRSQQVGPDAQGRMATEIVSSGAPLKRPDPSTDEGRAALQAEVDAIEAVFVAAVAKGRGVSPATVRAEFGRGAMVAARQAVEVGMADRIGTLEGVLGKGRRIAPTATGRSRALAAAEVETRRRAAGNEE
jgi:ClpP class serine protease